MLGFIRKLLSFTAMGLVAYVLVIGVVANTAEPLLFNGKPFTNVPLNDRFGGLSVLRYREADTFGKVDVVFLGSSHCYRTFDTAWYSAQGIRSFNLGSTAQAPVITYHVASKYLDILDPDLVVLEVYSETLRLNGVESLLDQLTNRPVDFSLVRMTAAAGGVKAWNGMLARFLNLTDEPVSSRTPPYRPGNGHYVSGGFVKRDLVSGGQRIYEGPSTPVSPKQLKYLERLIGSIRAEGRKMVLVSQPLPHETLAVIDDYDEIQNTVAAIANLYGVPFFDFNGLVETDGSTDLDDRQLFFDYHHFNGAGVAAFNPVFLELLRREGWL